MTTTSPRATTVAAFNTLQDKVFSAESIRRGQAFEPHPDDLFIAPYAKSGTTWLQQLAHGLRTRGDMDFEEISYVVPWIEVAHDMGVDLHAPQVARPRLFKTHFNWHDIPKGGRYICAFRHPEDVLVSYYRFMEGWFFASGALSLDSFADAFFPADDQLAGYWLHLVSWWEQRANEDVLLMAYEEIARDLPATIHAIAKLMRIPLDTELLAIVQRQSSRGFMLEHRHQFDERGIRMLAKRQAGLAFHSPSHKVTGGAGGDARYRISRSLRARFERMWREQVAPRLGLADYAELQQALRAGRH